MQNAWRAGRDGLDAVENVSIKHFIPRVRFRRERGGGGASGKKSLLFSFSFSFPASRICTFFFHLQALDGMLFCFPKTSPREFFLSFFLSSFSSVSDARAKKKKKKSSKEKSSFAAN